MFHYVRYHTLCRLLGHRFEGCVCNRCGFSRHEVDPKSEGSEARCTKCGQTVPVERVTDATELCPDCNGSGRVEAGFSNGYMIEEDCPAVRAAAAPLRAGMPCRSERKRVRAASLRCSF